MSGKLLEGNERYRRCEHFRANTNPFRESICPVPQGVWGMHGPRVDPFRHYRTGCGGQTTVSGGNNLGRGGPAWDRSWDYGFHFETSRPARPPFREAAAPSGGVGWGVG